MQTKKRFIILLACISLLCSGLFLSCDNPSGAGDGTGDGKKTENQNGSQSGNGADGEVIGEVTNTEAGIKLTWGNLPEGTKHLRIQTMIGSEQYDLFEINDLSKYSYVIDENVTKGKPYQYRFVYLDEKYNWFNSSNWQTIKAEGGKGERVITATPASSGIKITGDLPEDFYSMTLQRFNDNHVIYYYLGEKAADSDGSFTDKYVDNGEEYEYRLVLTVGTPRHFENNQEIPADPLVQYPRFKPVKATATGGAGSIKATTLPKAEYNSSDKTITLSQKPVFSVTPNSWWMSFRYSKRNNGSWNFANFSSYQNNQNVKTLNSDIPDGYWRFSECYIELNFENFTYSYSENELPDVPEEILLNVKMEDLFFPTATATADGIEISWDKSKLPADTERLYIQSTGHWFDISDLSINSILDKYIEEGKTYEYYIRACNKNGNELLRSESVKVKATGGKGKLKIENENKITVNYDEKAGAVAFSELPKLTDNPSEWNVNFEYNNSRYLFSINSTDKNLITNLYDAPAGDWTFTSYYINDYSNPAYRYCQWDDNLDVFANFPETITISDAYKPKLTATAVEDGIKLQWENLPAQTKKLQINANHKFIEIYDLTLNSFVDNYVEPGKTYEYSIRVSNESGNTSVQSESVSVKATGGKGKFRINNKISVIYNVTKDSVTFSELPVLTDTPTDWNINFNYQDSNKNLRTLFGIRSGNNKLTYSLGDAQNGDWTFDGYWINDNHDTYRYCQYEESLESFTKFPEKIEVTDIYRPTLTATLVDEGIKFEWKNIPENTTDLYVRLNKKNGKSITELRLSSIDATSIIDKYVDANTEYDCYINWKNVDGTRDNSKTIFVTPKNGLGEVRMINEPAASFDSQTKKVTFTTLPDFSVSADCSCSFGYWSEQNKNRKWLYGIEPIENSLDTWSSLGNIDTGSWTLDNYCVWFNCDGFKYEHYEYDDISMLSGIPQSFSF